MLAIDRAPLAGAMLSVLACLFVAGCKGATVTPVAPLQSAARTGDDLAPIQLDQIVFNVDRGLQIGAYRGGRNYTGCGVTLAPEPIFWRTGRVSVNDAEIIDIFGEALRRAGYKVTGNSGQLFADMTAGATEAEYLVGGRVDAIVLDVCDERDSWTGNLAGKQSGEVSIDMTWQVFSRLERQVVLETKSRGSATLEQGVPDGEVELLLRGIAAAATNLAADQQFHGLLLARPGASATLAASATPQSWPQIALRPTAPFAGGIAANMRQIQASVVTIRSAGGQGSGFFIAPDLILTNEHVVGAAARLKIVLINGGEVYARTLRRDAARDVALLQVESGSYPALPLRRALPGVAEEVYAIGSPLDTSLAGTVTKGIVSQLKRDAGLDLIQADVAIQPGNSGGPLLDAGGAVIGLSQSGVVDGSDHMVGINFFVPIDDALTTLNVVAGQAP